ncbi:hypothetical protein [Sulfurimonas sp.]|uniref:hypothetical protein n=1 Tax=Sulfurimonas sp. TaxID=2022749 RepID=UPI003568B71F
MTYYKSKSAHTLYPNAGQFSRWGNTPDATTVSDNSAPLANDYLNYLQEENLEESKYFSLLKEFEATKVDLNEAKYVDFLQYLADYEKIQHDRELYSHLVRTLDYFVANNMLPIDTRDDYVKSLNKILYSSNQEYEPEAIKSRHTKVDYTLYKNSDVDFRDVYNNQILNELAQKGGEIYFNSNNKFYFKLSEADELDEYPKRTLEAILTKEFKFKVKITDDVLEYKDIDMEDFIFDSPSYEVISTKMIGGYDA